MRTVDIIRQSAQRYADRTALVCSDATMSYAQFYEACLQTARRLSSEGICAGSVVPLRAVPTAEYLVRYFALHILGAVAVPLAKDIREEDFVRYERECEGATLPEGTADILFTTGTTGRSKGVVISHDAIIADAGNLIAGHGYTQDLCFIISGPLNHCGCWSKVFPCLFTGATIVLKDGLRDLDDFFSTIESSPAKVATFMVPSAINILMQFGAERLASLSEKIDFIETGGAPMSHNEMVRLCQLFPHSRLYNTYASTESGIICTYEFSGSDCVYGCVGRPMKHSRVMISPEGHILCGGRTLMTCYFNDPSLTAAVMKDGLITMSDIGRLDDSGMLHLCGRDNDTINIGAYKVEPTEVENVVMELPYVKDCICIGVPHVILGTALKLLYVADDGAAVSKKDIAMHIKSRLESYKIPQLYEQVSGIRMTFNGKKDRKSYREE